MKRNILYSIALGFLFTILVTFGAIVMIGIFGNDGSPSTVDIIFSALSWNINFAGYLIGRGFLLASSQYAGLSMFFYGLAIGWIVYSAVIFGLLSLFRRRPGKDNSPARNG